MMGNLARTDDYDPLSGALIGAAEPPPDPREGALMRVTNAVLVAGSWPALPLSPTDNCQGRTPARYLRALRSGPLSVHPYPRGNSQIHANDRRRLSRARRSTCNAYDLGCSIAGSSLPTTSKWEMNRYPVRARGSDLPCAADIRTKWCDRQLDGRCGLQFRFRNRTDSAKETCALWSFRRVKGRVGDRNVDA